MRSPAEPGCESCCAAEGIPSRYSIYTSGFRKTGMTAGQLITLWTIRLACILYAAACAGWLTSRDKPARLAWTLAYFFYVMHVGAAFASYHHWSHQAAYRETAR